MTYWFVFQQGQCPGAFRQAGAKNVSYLPMAADPAIHHPMTLSDKDRRDYGADVSFVGAGYANRRQLFPALLRQPWSFKLWGNEWEGADDLQSVLQLNGTRIDTLTCMKVFNATAINLNLHSTTGVGLDPQADFVNPRTFELASCGAFQLVDHRSLLPEFFTAQEMVSFRTFNEVPGLVGQWLRRFCSSTSHVSCRSGTRLERAYLRASNEGSALAHRCLPAGSSRRCTCEAIGSRRLCSHVAPMILRWNHSSRNVRQASGSS